MMDCEVLVTQKGGALFGKDLNSLRHFKKFKQHLLQIFNTMFLCPPAHLIFIVLLFESIIYFTKSGNLDRSAENVATK